MPALPVPGQLSHLILLPTAPNKPYCLCTPRRRHYTPHGNYRRTLLADPPPFTPNISSHDNMLHIKLCNHPAKCPNDVMTQFWRQHAGIKGARRQTVLVPTQAHARRAIWHGSSKHVWLARSSAGTHVLAGKELSISERCRRVSMPLTRRTCFTRQ